MAAVPVGRSVMAIASAVGVATATEALPDFVVSSVDVAVIVAVPDPDGVKTPLLLTEPIPDGLIDQVTALL